MTWRGNSIGWGGLARIYAHAARYPVVDPAIAKPVLTRRNHFQENR